MKLKNIDDIIMIETRKGNYGFNEDGMSFTTRITYNSFDSYFYSATKEINKTIIGSMKRP